MKQTSTFVISNAELIRQGVTLLGSIDRNLYGKTGGRGSIGSHFRHCLDFFESFLAGYASGRVDYCTRERDERVARDFDVAAMRVASILARLDELHAVGADTPLEVRAEDAGDTDDAWVRSTVGRELQALLSHTVHHYAILAILLRLEGIEVGATFGVAPSTLAYWRSATN